MKKCEERYQHRPVYETPKVSTLDEIETYLGSEIQGNCSDGSGDSLGCISSGNAATGNGCAGDGNSAFGTLFPGDEKGCIGDGNSPSADLSG